ncbi:MAG TPA: helix-turn-helix domain-containing protein [Chitinophagaceae bacterium]|nr:helix-turn-helix domain-containing protein [Chitinophagaceae bacterium]
MSVTILTKEDLLEFKKELLAEMKAILEEGPAKPKKWLRSPAVRELLQVSPGTLQTLRINGTLKYSKIGGIVFYDYNHILELLEKNQG